MLPRVGIVGSPEQITLLVPILQSFNFPVKALWCKNHDKRRRLATKFSVPFLAGDFKELLLHSEVELVYVATAPGSQAEIAVKALTSGKHCICQKPPTISQEEAQKMVTLSRYYSRLQSLLESHLRFLPAVCRLKTMLKDGYCGDLLVIEARVEMGSLVQDEAYSWKCESSMGGGVLNRVGADIIDLISFVSGQRACKGHASLSTFRPTTRTIHGYRVITSDDFCCFQLKCGGQGLAAIATLNSHAPGHFNFHFSVTGTSGRLRVQGLDLLGCKEGGKEEVLLKQEMTDLKKFGIKENTKFPADLLQHLVLGYQEMFGSLVKVFEEKPLSAFQSATFEDGVYIRTVLDALHASHKGGGWVDIPAVSTPSPGMEKGANPFWTTSSSQLAAAAEHRKPSKSHEPIYV